MTAEKRPKLLKHYTSIENLFKILESGCLLLSDPEKWEDKNDIASVRAFCRLKGEKTKARVLCFADGEESIYHWNTFSEDGCYIKFDKEDLLKEAKKQKFLPGPVIYKQKVTAAELREMKEKDIPFLKRKQYECEKEYRIIWFGEGKETPKIHFKRNAIKIMLSPKISDTKRKNLQTELEKKYGIKAFLSRVLESKDWIDRFENLNKKR